MNLGWVTIASIGWVMFLGANASADASRDSSVVEPKGEHVVEPKGEPQAIELESFRSHSRIAIRADEGIEPIWKDRDGGFELQLKGVWLSDLGAPLGGEQEWASRLLPKLKDERLEKIELSETAQGVVIRGSWKFPAGKAKLADPKMERFDFREKSPARYVVDFWQKPGPTVADVEGKKLRDLRMAERRALEEMRERRLERKIASQKERTQAEDLGRFCRQPLSIEQDVFLPFAPLHEKLDLSKWIITTTADADFDYVEPPGSSRDAQYMRLALDLYRQGKPALAIKTADFFDTEHPKSPLFEQMRFLRANAMLKLGHVGEAETILRELSRSGRKTEVTTKAAVFLAVKAFERRYYLGALEAFSSLYEKNSDHALVWVFHMAAAESLYALKQADRAAKEYQWVAVNGPDEASRSQGALRLGDLYLDRQQYERALAAYFQGLRRFGKQAETFPSVHVNRAEALYWLEDFDRASEAFTAFLTQYPSHPSSWRASYRLGEILARKADPASQAKARERFYETVNRFPFSPGATLARLRLLPCGDHGGFELSAADTFFEREAKNFKGGEGEVLMDRYNDLRALSRVQTYISMASARKSVDVAIDESQNLVAPRAKERVIISMSELFRRSILDLLAEGKKFDALKFYETRRPKVKRLETDPDYLLKLSQAASDLGLGTTATTIASTFQDAATDLARRGRALASQGDPSDLDVRLKKAETTFTEAKALWIAIGGGAEKGEALEKKLSRVSELLATVPEESEFSYEREIILGLMSERSGRGATALNHALRAQILMPASSAREDSARLSYWVGRLQAASGSKRAAVDGFRALEALPKASGTGRTTALGVLPVPRKGLLILAEAELLSEQGKWGEAAASYSRAVDEGAGGNHALYRYAQALEKTESEESHRKAKVALEKLAKSDQDDFWRKLARESLTAPQEGTRK